MFKKKISSGLIVFAILGMILGAIGCTQQNVVQATATPIPATATIVPAFATPLPTTLTPVPPTPTLMPNTSQPKVLIMLSEVSDVSIDYFLKYEVGVMVDILTKAGLKVLTASNTGRLLGVNTTLQPDMKIADVKVEEYVGIMIPCMGRPTPVNDTPEEINIIKKALEQGKIVAAQMGGVYVLESAGVLQGKQIAMLKDNKTDFPDAIYKGEGVVIDGNIITGGICPYMTAQTGKKGTTVDLTQSFIEMLKLH